MEYKKVTLGGFNLHLIKTDKFKTTHVEVIFHNNVKVEDITKRQFISKIISESNKTYKTNRDVNLKLEDLYDASFYAYNSKVGNAFITSFAIDFLNPEYTEKTSLKESIKFLFDMILNPNVNISEFENKTFNIVKERLKDSINVAKEDYKRLSYLNAISYLGNTPSAYSNLGDLKSLEEITSSNLYEYYLEMLKNDYIDIYAVGNLNMDDLTKNIIEYAKFNVIKNHVVNFHVYNPKMKEKSFTDSVRAAQSNITMILNLNKLTIYEERYVANVYNIILGAGSAGNKLFKKLREENSLCYGVSSFYQKYDGLIVITTGVDHNAGAKAVKLIKECLKEMNNNITDEELKNAKEQILTSLIYAKDNVDRIIDNYFYQDLKELDDIDERIKIYKELTKEDIYALCKKISVALVYTLEGGTHE